MRMVLDADVVVAGMRSPTGASAAVLMAARRRRVVLLATVALFLEYEAVCDRQEHRAASGLSRDEVRIFLDALANVVGEVEPTFYGGADCAMPMTTWCSMLRSTARRTPS
jgi:predicted nucleic acid-binding protein